MEGTRTTAAGVQEGIRTTPVHVQEGIYRADKILFHRDRLDRLARNELVAPITAHLVISDLCNHNCSFCSFRMEDNLQNAQFAEIRAGRRNNNPNRMIPRTKVFEILDDLNALGTLGVEFTGGGEPAIHPDAPAIFERCLDVGLEAALVTNGQLLDERFDPIVTRFTWVRVSIDAGTSETYARVRGVHKRSWHEALRNAERLVRARDRQHSDTTIGAGFVVYRENWREVYEAVRRFKATGFDSVRIGAIFNSTQKAAHFDGFLEPARELCAAAKRDFEDADFRVANNFDARIADLESGGTPSYPRCTYQELVTYIGGDQKVYRCCDTAYNPIGYLGDLRGQRFAEVWRDAFARGEFRGFRPDQSCEFCMFNNRNVLALRYLEDPAGAGPRGQEPPHIAFV
jgi:MoaA/NifB/PqqE/SkfB family radical SAM enzyme